MFIKDIFWKSINPEPSHLDKSSFSLTTAVCLIFPQSVFLSGLDFSNNLLAFARKEVTQAVPDSAHIDTSIHVAFNIGDL